jgi:hypothetical protein
VSRRAGVVVRPARRADEPAIAGVLGTDVRSRGDLVRVDGGIRWWTVGLHAQLVEVHEIEGEADARVSGEPARLYRWLWGRAAEADVEIEGDRSAVRLLRSAMARATA